MNALTKTQALEIARHSIKQQAENLLYLRKNAAEVAKFEVMALAIVAKGEALSDDFFAALPDDMRDGAVKRGTAIIRAINAATAA